MVEENESQTKCAMCQEKITDTPWYCYYADEYDEGNLLCGDGNWLAEWMQNNTCQLGDY